MIPLHDPDEEWTHYLDVPDDAVWAKLDHYRGRRLRVLGPGPLPDTVSVRFDNGREMSVCGDFVVPLAPRPDPRVIRCVCNWDRLMLLGCRCGAIEPYEPPR